ncbi:MAG: PorV/PorQ family protein [Gemmatimonadetes bacterium]|nr:PorV/PorQ family protein [Gemmatimonadota bacterium]
MNRGPAISLLLLTALASAIAPVAARAQSKTGTTIGQFLGIEPSARTAAMGNAGVAFADGVEFGYFNPAAVGLLDRSTALFTHCDWFIGVDLDYAAAAVPVGRYGTAYASVTALSSGDISVRTVDQPLGTGERYDVADTGLTLGFSRRITARFSAGVYATWVSERIWRTKLTTLTLSLGTLYEFPGTGIRLGAALMNLGTDGRFTGKDLAIQYDADPDVYGDNSALPAEQYTGSFPVPILFRVGASWEKDLGPKSRFLAAVDALHPNDNTESVNLGAEWLWRETAAVRGGYQTLFQKDSEFGPTFGFGLRGDLGETEYRVDYAWAAHESLQETHRLTFSLVF